jgi:hypothetical protein
MLRLFATPPPLIAAVTGVALASCISATEVATDAAGLPSRTALKLKQPIVAWSAGFFADPASIRSARISDPIPFRTRSGSKTWLVCIEYNVREPGGGYVGLQRLAFGVGSEPPTPPPAPPGSPASGWTPEAARRSGETAFYPPLGRHRNEISNRVCDVLPLSWAPFPELERLGTPLSRLNSLGSSGRIFDAPPATNARKLLAS